MDNCSCNRTGLTICEIVGIILSVIAGVTAGILFSLGLIPLAENLIIVALIIAGLSLVILLGAIISGKGYGGYSKCVCKSGLFVLTGAIGTLISATLAITTGFTITLIASIIFVAFSAFFLVLLIAALICLFTCLIKQNCKCRDEVL